VRSATFTYDNENPSTTVAYPTNYSNFSGVKTLVTLSGALSDNCSGVSQVNVRIFEKGTGDYFNGSSFAAGVSDLAASIYSSSWTYIDTDLITEWAHGTYYIYAWAQDTASNTEALEPATTIYYDTVLPLSDVGYPGNGTSIATEPTITGTAADADTGVNKVEISLRRDRSPYSSTPGAEDYAWNGSTWTSWGSDIWIQASGTTAWSFSIPISSWVYGGHYWVKSMATDNGGNIESLLGMGISLLWQNQLITYLYLLHQILRRSARNGYGGSQRH